jgi:hypothetical protein
MFKEFEVENCQLNQSSEWVGGLAGWVKVKVLFMDCLQQTKIYPVFFIVSVLLKSFALVRSNERKRLMK